MNENIRTYLKQMLADAGQVDLGADLENQMIEDLNSRLEDRLILVAMENLPQDKQEELTAMAEDKESSKSLEEYVKNNIPNWEEVFARALQDFRETYLGAQ
jgi:hypothetical protein